LWVRFILARSNVEVFVLKRGRRQELKGITLVFEPLDDPFL